MIKRTGILVIIVGFLVFSCMEVLSWGSRKRGCKNRCCACVQRCFDKGRSKAVENVPKSKPEEKSSSFVGEDKALKKRENVDQERLMDVVICGSGPAGLSAATHAARARVKTVVIEGETPGGQLMGTTLVENFPGYPADVLGQDIIKNLRTQAERFGPLFVQDYVEKIDFSLHPYEVRTKKGKIFYAKTVIIATGVTSSYLGVVGEKEYYGKGVSHCSFSEAPLYKDKNVVIVGGGGSAVEDALQLASYAKNVTLLVRGAKMRAISSSQEKLKKVHNISILYNTSVKEILGNNNFVTGVAIEDKVSGEKSQLLANGVFIAVGCEPNSGFLTGDLELDKDGYIIVEGATQKASLPGVFVAGDIVAGKVKLASVAVGAGTQAGFEAVKFLFDQAALDNKEEKTDQSKEADYKVCFCKGVYYSEIVAAIRGGCKTFEGLRQKLGLCSGCRSCKGAIEAILKKELAA